MRTTISAFSASLMCVGIFASSLSAQTVRDIDALERIGAKEAGIKPLSQTENHTKLTAADALRVRILEIESGERAFANRHLAVERQRELAAAMGIGQGLGEGVANVCERSQRDGGFDVAAQTLASQVRRQEFFSVFVLQGNGWHQSTPVR